jgi:hypothetical protein
MQQKSFRITPINYLYRVYVCCSSLTVALSNHMEASSPLAAMQPASILPPWASKDFYNSHNSRLPGASRFGPGAFNFRDLSMKPPTSDYFLMKPVRGSSPTASLAADLSQNFHIDMRYIEMNRLDRSLLIHPKSSTADTPSVALYI